MSYTLVLIRHGESEWNKANLFTGWTDVELSENGVQEAVTAGKKLKEEGFSFDICYTSYLLAQLDEEWIPMVKDWRLNERHYGALQGLNKADTAAKYGDEQVKIWRRSFDVCPPELTDDDERNPKNQAMYKNVDPSLLPNTESLETCIARVVPYYKDVITKDIADGKKVLIAAHGNSLRSLVMYLDDMTPEQILETNIPTAVPLVYELDDNFKAISHHYLLSDEELKARMDAVANQGKAK